MHDYRAIARNLVDVLANMRKAHSRLADAHARLADAQAKQADAMVRIAAALEQANQPEQPVHISTTPEVGRHPDGQT